MDNNMDGSACTAGTEKISVIMPAYNAEKTVGRAVRSILDQDWPDFELLIIDDGSRDRTAEICRGFGDARIRVLSRANAGPAAARNLGLGEAKGELVCFVDADDSVRRGWMRRLADGIRGARMSVCGYLETDGMAERDCDGDGPDGAEGGETGSAGAEIYTECGRPFSVGEDPAGKGTPEKTAASSSGKEETVSAAEAMKRVITDEKTGGYLWNKMFRRDLIEKNRLRFHDRIYVGEDLLFVEQYLQGCDTVHLTDLPLYNYCYYGTSVSHDPDPKILTILHALEKICRLSGEEDFRKVVANRYVRQFLAFAAIFPEELCPPGRLRAFLKETGISRREAFLRLTPDYRIRYLLYSTNRKLYARLMAAHKKAQSS